MTDNVLIFENTGSHTFSGAGKIADAKGQSIQVSTAFMSDPVITLACTDSQTQKPVSVTDDKASPYLKAAGQVLNGTILSHDVTFNDIRRAFEHQGWTPAPSKLAVPVQSVNGATDVSVLDAICASPELLNQREIAALRNKANSLEKKGR